LPERDIDYAAIAVESALREKYGRHNDLAALKVTAGANTLSIIDGERVLEGSRDNLLARIRASGTYAELWS
jgi:hypothetical protein